MKLWHGSNLAVPRIDLSRCRPNKDFGRGFYLTPIPDQAERMARRVARIYGGEPVVGEYEFDEAAFADPALRTKRFGAATREWATFVIANRNPGFPVSNPDDANRDGHFDFVVGPVANDDLALLFRQFVRGYIGVETLVREMEFRHLTQQYSFHSAASIRYLAFVGSRHA